MDETKVFRGEFSFSYKTYWDHFRGLISDPTPIIAFAIAAFGVLWTFGEASIQFSGANPRGWMSYALLITGSILASFGWNAYRYLHRCPEGFEGVSATSRKIAHLQRPLWEFRLARSLLAQKLTPFENELRDLETGREFVIADKPDTLQDYINWASTRPRNLSNMLQVANQLLLNDFPASLQSTDETPADPATILDAVDTLARFYGETVAFERAARSVMPSEELEALHNLLLGWSDSIRDGVRQLFKFLQHMCECNPAGDNHITFEIVFDSPTQVDRFCEEMDRLEPHVVELTRNW